MLRRIARCVIAALAALSLFSATAFAVPQGTAPGVATAIANIKTYLLGFLQANYTLQVPTAAALRSTVVFPGVSVYRNGFYAAGDGGGAFYKASTSACGLDDGGSCLNASGGSWVLDASLGQGPLRPQVFGAKCDGTTNDTSAEQATWNASAVVSAQAQLVSRGMSCLVDSLVPPSNSHARIDGMLQSSGAAKTLLSFSGGQSNVVIEGDGTLDNAFPVSGPAPNPSAPVACIASNNAVSYISVRGLTLQNCGNWPVNMAAYAAPGGNVSTHLYFSYVKALGGGNRNSFEFAAGCDDCWADHILVDGLTLDIGFAFYGGVTNSGLTNSRINNTSLGVAVLSDGAGLGQGAQSYPSSNILIQGNEITNNQDEAVFVHAVSTTDSNAFQRGIRIIGNDGHGNNRSLSTTPSQANQGGETIDECDGCTSIGNFWHDDKSDVATASPVGGILANSTSKNFTSIGDTVYNEGGPGGVGIGGIVASGAANASFHDFHAYDYQTNPSMAQAISGSCNSDCMIDGTRTSGFANPWAGLGGDIEHARLWHNEGGLSNYVQSDTVMTGYTNMASPRGFLSTPTSSSTACIVGQYNDDANYHYVCVAANKWRRVALSDF